MKELLQRGLLYARTLGLDLEQTGRALRGLPSFVRDLGVLLHQGAGREFPLGPLYPCWGDRLASAGELSQHYFYQDWYVASRIFEERPERHVDIGSRVDGFVAHVASFREIEVFDLRPLRLAIPQVRFRQIDFMETHPELDGYCDSLSSLHAVEHFGLGRYGDQVDPDGHCRALASMGRLLRPGGRLYLSVPIGAQRLEYNAHRVFALPHLLELLRGDYHLETLSYIDDENEFFPGVPLTSPEIERSFGCRYGCAVLELTRLA